MSLQIDIVIDWSGNQAKMSEHIEAFLYQLKSKALINGATDATIIDAMHLNLLEMWIGKYIRLPKTPIRI